MTKQSLIAFSETFGSPQSALDATVGFDMVVCWQRLDVHRDDAVFGAIDRVLRRGGRLLITMPVQGKVSFEQVIDALPRHFKVIERRCHGSIGTAATVHAYRFLRQRALVRRAFSHPGLRGIAKRLVVFPLFLVLYPAASLIASGLNLFGSSERFCAERTLVLEKSRAPARD